MSDPAHEHGDGETHAAAKYIADLVAVAHRAFEEDVAAAGYIEASPPQDIAEFFSAVQAEARARGDNAMRLVLLHASSQGERWS